MVKHIVFWTLKDSAEGRSAHQNAKEIKKKLEALNGRIPGLIKLEVGIDFGRTEASADVALYSELSDRDALNHYINHPEHVAVSDFVGKIRHDRTVVDYEI
nr:Dabb family protein [uncultured Desulfobacter sp.]